MNNQMKRVVLKFLTALGEGDAATATQCLTEDAVAVTKGFGRLSGIRQREAILATIASFRELMPGGLQPDVLSVTAEEDRVVVEFEGKATLANGKPYCNQYCWVFSLREGRICRISEYLCTALADELLYPLVTGQTSSSGGR